MEAYAHLIPQNEQIPYFLYFTVDPSRIDVNIHPTKTEIKFEDEQAIWQILMASVREVLGRSNMAPSIDFDVADCPDIPAFPTGDIPPRQPMPTVDTSYNPFKQSGASDSYKRPTTHWDDLYKGIGDGNVGREIRFDMPDEDLPWGTGHTTLSSNSTEQEGLFDTEEHTPSKCTECYQYKGHYIVTSTASGLMLVDQHRAHVRILFERYLKQLNEQPAASQGMLFPEIVELSLTQAALMESLIEDFNHLGFDISNMGGGAFAIQGTPEGIAGLAPSKLVSDILSSAMEKGVVTKEDIYHNMALTMARSAALVVGEVLTPTEMNHIVDELLACNMPNYTPDGKKTLVVIEDRNIGEMFLK
jgi:DNA mismatch repair protein MutL